MSQSPTGGASPPTQIEKLMKALGCSEDEALDVLETDKRIDRGEKLFELAPELQAGAKKARQADRKPTNAPKRVREVDNAKRHLISVLQTALSNADCTAFDIQNPEREFLFTHDGKKYKITLSCPRN